MPFSHPGLFEHPKTGVFWIRRRIPSDLVSTLGRRTIQETLGTKDRRLAEVLFLERMGEITRTWNCLMAGRSSLGRRTISGLAGEFYRSLIKDHEEDPGEPGRWEAELGRMEARLRPLRGRPNNPHGTLQAEMHRFLLARGYDYSQADTRHLVTAFADARFMAYRRLAKMASGDYSPDADASRFPVLERTASSRSPAEKGRADVLTVADHWESYVKDTGIAVGTQRVFRPILIKCGTHLGTTNLAGATTQAIEGWVVDLASLGLAAKTINEGYLAAVRAFFAWGITKKLVTHNPCAGVTYRSPRTDKLTPSRPQGLTDAEAALILSETLRDPDPRLSAKAASARRWIPWICAYTGARVNEATQLRVQDVTLRVVDGQSMCVLLITPEAGSVKDRRARLVPLHPHVTEQGFADFARERCSGPLFYDDVRPRGGSLFHQPYRKVGERIGAWVRDIGVTDVEVAPSHGWRHRFNTEARKVRMIPEIRDAIVGHAMRTEGEAYGDVPLGAMYAELCRLPRYEVEKPEGRRESASKRDVASRPTARRSERTSRGPGAPLNTK